MSGIRKIIGVCPQVSSHELFANWSIETKILTSFYSSTSSGMHCLVKNTSNSLRALKVSPRLQSNRYVIYEPENSTSHPDLCSHNLLTNNCDRIIHFHTGSSHLNILNNHRLSFSWTAGCSRIVGAGETNRISQSKSQELQWRNEAPSECCNIPSW
jgi:hypothetical protein